MKNIFIILTNKYNKPVAFNVNHISEFSDNNICVDRSYGYDNYVLESFEEILDKINEAEEYQ